MERLDGLDSSFVSLETSAAPMQVAMTAVFDPSTAPVGYSFESLRTVVEDRLHLVPPFRRRLIEMPGRIQHPVWVDDPAFDLEEHLHRHVLPSPGGPIELEEFTAQVISRPLDRSRPLWEMYLVEGLEGGMVGVVTKVHHAAIDGISGAELTATLLDVGPEPTPVAPPDSEWLPEPLPSTRARARDSVDQVLRQPIEIAGDVARAAIAGLRIWRHNRRPGTNPPPAPFSAPRTPCNAPLTSCRHVGFTHLGLDEVKQIKNATDATVNDVVLAVCGAALRTVLEDSGEPPQRSLVAAVPVSVRKKEQRGAMGNRLSVMLVDLATTIDDPVARLRAIAAGSRAAKTQDRLLGPDTISQLARLTPPAILARAGALESQLNLLARLPPLCNLIVSSFPGPAFPLYCAGARMVAAYPMGPLMVGTGLNITVQSYLGSLWFGVVACPDVVPEPWTLPARMTDALDELTKQVTSPKRAPRARTIATFGV